MTLEVRTIGDPKFPKGLRGKAKRVEWEYENLPKSWNPSKPLGTACPSKD